MARVLIKVTVLLTSLFCLYAGFAYEGVIRLYYPSFSPGLFGSGIILFVGMMIAMIMRNQMVGIISIIGSFIFPWLVQWFVIYWPYSTGF